MHRQSGAVDGRRFDQAVGGFSLLRILFFLLLFLLLVVVLWSGAAIVAAQTPNRIRADGTGWRAANGTPFEWKGITAFRLLELVAHGREAEADRYLAWAASQHLNVVRVLAMAHVLFQLTPEDGRRALDKLLDLADRRGIVVEIVALADTKSYPFDVSAHVRHIGAIAARHPNAVIEIANEPYHPTQAEAVHKHAFLRELRGVIPREVAVSVGTLDEDKGELAGGDYVTWHSPRDGNWPDRMREGAAFVRRFGKPVVADEPMGAADRAIAGRRDNNPDRFRRAAEIARESGLGVTFHYEGGLHAKLPTPGELACLRAWMSGLERENEKRQGRIAAVPPAGTS